MRKLYLLSFFGLLILLSSSFVFVSCQDGYDSLAEDLSESQKFEIIKFNTNNINSLNALKEHIAQGNMKTRSNSCEKIVFDSEKISEYKISDTNLNFYFVPQANLDKKSSVNYSSGYVMENNKIIISGIIKEELLDENIKRITYLKNDFTIINQITVNKVTKKVSVEKMISTPMIMTRSESSGMGDCVSKCIGDAYLEEGWGSVALWCTTLYCPEVGVAVLLLCTSKCGVSNS